MIRARRTRRATLLACVTALAFVAPASAHHEVLQPNAAQAAQLAAPDTVVAATPAAVGHGQVRVKAKKGYNSDYMFGMTRGVADSIIHPAVKAPLFLLTVPLDVVLLPFAAVGGFFG